MKSKESLELNSDSQDSYGAECSPSLQTKETKETENNQAKSATEKTGMTKENDAQAQKSPQNQKRGRNKGMKSPEMENSNERDDSMITYSRSSEESPEIHKKKRDAKNIIQVKGTTNNKT